jgi:hypothetical protein
MVFNLIFMFILILGTGYITCINKCLFNKKKKVVKMLIEFEFSIINSIYLKHIL